MYSDLARPAIVRFLTTAEGGRISEPVSGVRPHLLLDGQKTSCVVESASNDDVFHLGTPARAWISSMFEELLLESFAAAESFELYEGARLVAEGRFLDASTPPVPSR
jgi:hypothetical protein